MYGWKYHQFGLFEFPAGFPAGFPQYVIKSGQTSSFNQYFFRFIAEPLPSAMSGLKMATTSQGDGLIMTFDKEVYTFKCTSETDCKWSKEPYSLQISRRAHEMLPGSTSFLENC